MNQQEIKEYLILHHTEEDVAVRLDEEITEWVNEDWQDDYESEYDYYQDHNNREAEDVVIEEIVVEIEKHYKLKREEIESTAGIDLNVLITNHYSIL